MSQELVKLAKDNGSSDNISIVVVFLKPIEELAAMELPIDTKDLDTISQNGTNNMMNNNEKEALYDGITSTSIYVGKNSIEVGEETDDDEDEASRKISSSSGEDSAIGSDLKPGNNPFSSPGGGFGFGEVVNPFDGMTGKNNSEIPSVDEADSFEGRD